METYTDRQRLSSSGPVSQRPRCVRRRWHDDEDSHQSCTVVMSMDSIALRWFESYLTDRVQSFSYAGVRTPSFKVDCSVPQGSVLGPRCFISYTEDIIDVLERHAVRSHLYADDTQFYDGCRLDRGSALSSIVLCRQDQLVVQITTPAA